jgi:hypothetical protein
VFVDPYVENEDDLAEETVPTINQPFTLLKIKQSISKLLNNKTCGQDGIPSEFYILTANEIASILQTLLNKILETGHFSIFWRNIMIILLYDQDYYKYIIYCIYRCYE